MSSSLIESVAVDPRQILLFRGNTLVADFSDGKSTPESLGVGLANAASAMLDGDTLICGSGEVAATAIDFTANDIRVYFKGMTIVPTTGDDYSVIVNISGNRNVFHGLRVDGELRANSINYAKGVNVDGDSNLLVNCRVDRIYGGIVDSGDGIWITGDDNKLVNYHAEENHYSGLIVYGDRFTLDGGTFWNPGYKWMTVRAGLKPTYDGITLSNVVIRALQPGSADRASFSINNGSVFRKVTCDNIDSYVGDLISPGVSYNTSGREQCMKFDNAEDVHITNCRFRIGENAAAGGYSTGIAFQGTIKRVFIRDSWFSGGLAFGLEDIGLVDIEGCTFGGEINKFWLIHTIKCDHFRATDCTFNMHDGTSVFNYDPGFVSPRRLELKNCTFIGNGAGDQYVATNAQAQQLTGTTVNYNATYLAEGAGTMSPSNGYEGNLSMTTDANGSMLFDDTAINNGMPDPGAGPNYFSTLASGPNGAKIINFNWSPTGTQVVPEASWIAHGGFWKEYAEVGGGGGVTDHGDLTSIGTTTHAGIDSHIADDKNAHVSYVVLSDGDTTPSTNVGNRLLTNNASPITITDFEDPGAAGHVIHLIIGDDQTTIAHNANIDLSSGASWKPSLNDALSFIYDGAMWHEIGGLSSAAMTYREKSIGNLGTSGTIDLRQSRYHRATLNANWTASFTDPIGSGPLYLTLVQDGTGSRIVTWSGVSIAGSNPVINTGAGEETPIMFVFDSSSGNYHVFNAS